MITMDLGAVTAYALAVKNGFVGTEAEWIAHLEEQAKKYEDGAKEAAEVAEAAKGSAAASAAEAKKSAANAKGVADWSAPEGEPGHVLNRTHWVESGLVEILPECQPVYDETNNEFSLGNAPTLVAGETYIINWNGTEYICVAQDLSTLESGAVGIGDCSIWAEVDATLTGNGEPFTAINLSGAIMILATDGSTELTLAIYQDGEIVHKLDNKYLDLDWLPTTTEVPSTVYEETLSISSAGYKFWSASYIPFKLVDGAKYVVTWNGTDYECVAHVKTIIDDSTTATAGWMGNASRAYYSKGSDTGEPFCFEYVVIDAAQFWLRCDANSTVEVAVEFYEEVPNKMPAEFLPESVSGIIIRSSTADSTKKFKLTVDDSGTITATEI